jgi:putative oxidoreductase
MTTVDWTRIQNLSWAALRIVAGAMMACHGADKLFGWPGGHGQPELGSQLWFGGVIELAGGVLVAIGLFTRAAAFVTSGMMAVAYFQYHWQLHFDARRWLPMINDGELAVLYCFVFLAIFAYGPGHYSIDRRRTRS